MQGFKKEETILSTKTYLSPLMAGAVAGLSVEMAFYPLDTLKTRLQSQEGFSKSGQFRGMYRGLLTVATTSMPTTALFFMWYETTKNVLTPVVSPQHVPLVHMFAASVGEICACVLRVPTEVAKQRKQMYVEMAKKSSIRLLMDAFKSEGTRGVYRGFMSTLARDLPFSFIELPLWEFFKTIVQDRNDGQITGLQSAACGSAAGGLAAVITTPMDLAKTRIMLAPTPMRVGPVLRDIYRHAGLRGLFMGAAPRAVGFMVGGFVFFGVYNNTKSTFDNYFDS